MRRLTLRGMARCALAVAAIVLAAVAASACGSSGNSRQEGTPGQGAARTTPSLVSNAPTAPAGTPIPIDLSRFTTFNSATKGYSISYPSDWQVQEDAYASVNFSADQFNPPSQSVPNVSILCKRLAQPETTDAFLEQNVTLLRTQSNAEVSQPEQMAVAGQAAGLILYGTSQTTEAAAAFLVRNDCGWIVTLTASRGQRDAYMPAFRQMLASLVLR